ncbi:MAG: AlpA family phage regulatory protein [Rhodobacteraceae bacterium]|nr:AlpA family phage regulatory protein [Paracoccaceae bacterium]
MLDSYHRRKSVEKITGLSRSMIYEQMERGEFPRPIRIGRRAVAWRESDIAAWQAAREASSAT